MYGHGGDDVLIGKGGSKGWLAMGKTTPVSMAMTRFPVEPGTTIWPAKVAMIASWVAAGMTRSMPVRILSANSGKDTVKAGKGTTASSPATATSTSSTVGPVRRCYFDKGLDEVAATCENKHPA